MCFVARSSLLNHLLIPLKATITILLLLLHFNGYPQSKTDSLKTIGKPDSFVEEMLDSATKKLLDKEIELIKHQKENELLKRDNELLEKDKELQTLKDKEESEVRLFLIGIGILFILLTFGFIVGYFKHKKGNAQLTRRNEEILEKNREIALQKSNIEAKVEEEERITQELKNQRFLLHQQNKKLKDAQETIANQNIKLKTSNVVLEEKFKLRTKELEDSFAEMMSLHQQLDNYSYHSAHDLKGPIARIIGLSRIVKMEERAEELAYSIGLLEDEANKMGVFLDRIIKGLELKTKPLELKTINLSAFIKELFHRFENDSERYQLISSIPLNIEIETDKELLTTLCSNLIRNSIDYQNPEKETSFLKVNCKRIGVGWLELNFEDNGFGINQEAQAKIFEMFFKASENHKGAGLGLYEAKLISRKLGGEIHLSSSNSQSTYFCMKLPIMHLQGTKKKFQG
ncbi:MAG: signal transduction histidine kinase [Flammeovirgaceae bacterium]|jgi:signal transduction histidine kinase